MTPRTPAARLARLADAPSASALLILVVGIALVTGLNGNFSDTLLVLSLGYAVAVVGMSVQVGFSRQLAFSQSLFIGVGGYGVAVLNTKYGVPTLAALFVMLAIAAIAATIIGSLVTRAPGLALAMVTLLFPLILGGFVTFSSYLGETSGLFGIDVLWSGDDFTSSLIRSGVLAVAFLASTVYLCARVMNSGVGLELALVGEGQNIAESLGIPASRRKLEVFVFGSVLATLGGALYAGTQGVVSPDIFGGPAQLTLLVMLYVGGQRSLIGAAVGAIVIEFFTGSSNFVSTHILLIEGILLPIVLLLEPDGLAGLVHRLGRVVKPLLLRGRAQAPGTVPAPAVSSPAAPAATAPAGAQADEPDTAPPRPAPVSLTELTGLTERVAPVGGQGSEPPVLSITGLTRSFGGLVAVDNVSLRIDGPGLYGICGPNGAGKSTLFNLIGGSIPVESGTVLFQGKDVTGASMAHRARLGIARTFQSVHLMPGRTALDNVAVACLPTHQTFMTAGMFRRDLRQARDMAYEALREVGSEALAAVPTGRLTLEGQRMVELARARACDPSLLLLDEPASGLSIDQRERLGEILLEIATRTTVVLVEHDLEMIKRTVSKVFVLIDGRLEFEGGPREFGESPIVRTQLMGLVAVSGM